MRRLSKAERRRLEFQRIVWTAAQGVIAGLIGAPVLGLSAWQSIGTATITATLGALSSLIRRRLAALDAKLGIDESSGVEQ